jgi:prepilin-type N-terminal cleavage/methylation domain-containing protein
MTIEPHRDREILPLRRRVVVLKRRHGCGFQKDLPLQSKGFSLIEVMVAVLILGVSLVGLVHGINTALMSGKEAEMQSQAALLAAAQIEELRADGYYVEGETTGEFAGDLSVYSYRQNVATTQPEGLFEVTVAIEKTDSGEQIYELKTLLFDPPIIRDDTDKDKDKEKERNRRKRSE